MAGYSGAPLAKKLGIAEGMVVATIAPPADLESHLAPLPDGVTWKRQLRPPVDLALAFFTARRDVTKRWPMLTAAVGPAGVIWVGWPKKSSGVPTDLTED